MNGLLVAALDHGLDCSGSANAAGRFSALAAYFPGEHKCDLLSSNVHHPQISLIIIIIIIISPLFLLMASVAELCSFERSSCVYKHRKIPGPRSVARLALKRHSTVRKRRFCGKRVKSLNALKLDER